MWAHSYTLRAILAIVFLITFYAVAIALALGILAIPYFEVVETHRIHIKLAVVCVVASLTILWSLIPRMPTFEEPGPRISARDHPRLFALIEEIGRAMGLNAPDEVYLVPELNAFVSQRGGFLGMGSRRYMGLGLPLLSSLNVSQFKAVLAHEYGHYAGGETKLSGLVYATRTAMIRTITNLGERNFLRAPFLLMFKVYLRITQAISRQQELVADSWAVKLAGVHAHTSTIESLGPTGLGLEVYLHQELAPLRGMQVSPANYFQGFRQFLSSQGWSRALPGLKAALARQATDPYDSHPSAEERIAFARSLTSSPVPLEAAPAISLLSDPEGIERRFTEKLRSTDCRVIEWSEVGDIWRKILNRDADRLQARLPAFNFGAFCMALEAPASFQSSIERVMPILVGDRSEDRNDRSQSAKVRFLNAWISSLLGRLDFEWVALPGEPILLRKGETSLAPSETIRSVLEGKTAPDDFIALLKHEGLTNKSTWSISDQRRREETARRAIVKLEPQKKNTQVIAGPGFTLPMCCAVCCGPLEQTSVLSFRIGGMIKSDRRAQMEVPTCHQHSSEAKTAWDIREANTLGITLWVKNDEFARLMEIVNS